MIENSTNSSAGPRLLETIRAVRARVGDGLNDDELTRLLWRDALPSEAGFTFLSFSGGCVTLTVPQQDPADWYPAAGWIVPAKEQAARALAAKYGLSLCEPPDEAARLQCPDADPEPVHHHLEFTNRWEAVIIAHPCYLKVRLYGAASADRYVAGASGPLPLGPELLPDLAALYQRNQRA
jgi:hypothetical protein